MYKNRQNVSRPFRSCGSGELCSPSRLLVSPRCGRDKLHPPPPMRRGGSPLCPRRLLRRSLSSSQLTPIEESEQGPNFPPGPRGVTYSHVIQGRLSPKPQGGEHIRRVNLQLPRRWDHPIIPQVEAFSIPL